LPAVTGTERVSYRKEVIPLKVSPFHTSEPEDPERYHDNSACPYGQNIKPEHKVSGTGGRKKCSWCADH
jgi:hypothetical protein